MAYSPTPEPAILCDHILDKQINNALTGTLQGSGITSGYLQTASRIPVTREDMIEVALKLQEAASLVTQALNRLGGR